MRDRLLRAAVALFLELIRDRSVLLCDRRTPARRISRGHYRSETPSFDVCSGGGPGAFFSSKRDRSVPSSQGLADGVELGKAAMTWVGPWGVVIQLRRLYITLPARETGLTRPTEACCNKRVPSGQRRWTRFGFIFAG